MRISCVPCCGRCARGVSGAGLAAGTCARVRGGAGSYPALPERLEHLTIEGALPADIAERLWSLVTSLAIVENNAKIVAGTKALHHLLPDLVVPMDREYTGTFFQFHRPEWQDPGSQRRIFLRAYAHFAAIAERAHPGQYVTDCGWRTSPSKVIDNALIGFCKTEINGTPPTEAIPGTVTAGSISFEVTGYPPAKNEALSMLGTGHILSVPPEDPHPGHLPGSL
jgi:hypothetical protein